MGACHSKTNKSENTQLLPLNNKYQSKQINEWNVDDVYAWLMDNELPSVAKKFKKRHINGSQLINIKPQYLTNIEISIIHQQTLFNLLSIHKSDTSNSTTPNPRLQQTTISTNNTNLVDLNNKSFTPTVAPQISFISSTSSKHTDTPSCYTNKEPSPSSPISIPITNTNINIPRINSLSINISSLSKLNPIDSMPPLHEGKQTPPIHDLHLHTFRTTISNDTYSDIDDDIHTPYFDISPVGKYTSNAYTVPENAITNYTTGSTTNNTSNKPRKSDSSNNNNNQRKNDHSDNNNNNNNSDNFGSGGSGNNNNDDDDNKENKRNKNIDKKKDKKTKKKNNKNKEENKDDDEKQFLLNKDAAIFVPTTPVLASIAEEIDDVKKNLKISKGKNNKNKQKKKHDQFGVIGIIHVSRAFTGNIIPQKIKENIQNLYEYMHKTTILNCRNEYRDENIRIFNYDFHDKETNEILYCYALKQNGGSYLWKMDPNLYNKNEIQKLHNIDENDLPKSFRKSDRYSDALCKISNICGQLFVNVIHETKKKWSRKHVYTIKNKLYNQQRCVLYFTPEKFVQHLLCEENIKNNNKMIPIVVLNENKSYNIEYIKIVNIKPINNPNINIGISFKNEKGIMLTSIYLNKSQIINAHQLAVPNSDCSCLNAFNCNVNLLRIGNPDEDANRIKDLQKKFADLQAKFSDLETKINDVENKNDNPALLSVKSNSSNTSVNSNNGGLIQIRVPPINKNDTPTLVNTPSLTLHIKSNLLQNTPSLLTPYYSNQSLSVNSTPNNVLTPLIRVPPITPQTRMGMAFSNKTESKDNNKTKSKDVTD